MSNQPTCDHCSKELKTTSYEERGKVFCSKKCLKEHREELLTETQDFYEAD